MTGVNRPPNDSTLKKRLGADFALQAARLGVWELDPITNLINWDERCQELVGLTAANEIPYQEAILHIHPDDRQLVDDAFRWVMRPESNGQYDLTFRTIGASGGVLHWVRFTGQRYLNEAGEAAIITGVAQEVTQDKTSRQLRDANEAKMKAMIEAVPAAMVLFVGRDLIVEQPSKNFIDIIDRGPEVTGKPLRELMPELESQSFLDILDTVYTSGQPYHAFGTRVDIVQHDGSTTHNYFNLIYTPLFNEEGHVYAILSVATDVTEVVGAKQALEETREALQEAVELARLGTWQMDLTTGLIEYSPRLRAWHGLDPDEVITRERAYRLVRKTDWAVVKEAIAQAVMPGGNGSYDVEYVIEGGDYDHDRILHAQGRAYFNEQGSAYKISGTVQDVTVQRQLQSGLEQQVQERTEELAITNEELAASNEELAESNQLLERSNENLQQFAYIASHDLQEPLRKIQQFGSLIQDQYGDVLGEGVDYLQRMREAASRMSTLIQDLLNFARISTRQDTRQPVSLNEIIRLVMLDLDVVIEETGAVILVDSLPTVLGDASQLGQLFQNLLTNAIKFRQSDVPLVIRVNSYLVTAAKLPPSVKPTRSAKTYQRISVSDNGIGFEQQYAERIFQVFQRLHGKGKYAGTGIGLAICEKVVVNHGGAIVASSEPGRGATFTVYLPA